MWNLFLLALGAFQAIDQTEVDSYYQIAGIHGMPWYDWDGVPSASPGAPPQIGYCPHHDLLFASWHRPYLMLFEQKLQSIAIELAAQFGTPAYTDAATRLRLPYWDWAKALPDEDPMFPSALSAPTTILTLPTGATQEFANPLYSYAFHPLRLQEINGTGCAFSLNFPICALSPTTVRKATLSPSGTYVSNHTALDADLRRQLGALRRSVYAALTQFQPFNSFSNDGNCRGNGVGVALETPHNAIHNAMDPGHMSPPATAAFDPVFWLHHSNVDRHLALFQALWPETYLSPCAAAHATWTIRPGDELGDESPLLPFHAPLSTPLTPLSTRALDPLGYTYPEFLDAPSNASLVARINALYRDAPFRGLEGVGQGKGGDREKEYEYVVRIDMPASSTRSYDVVVVAGEGEGEGEGGRDGKGEEVVGKVGSRIVPAASPGAWAQNEGVEGGTVGTVIVTHVIREKYGAGEIKREEVGRWLRGVLRWRLELVSFFEGLTVGSEAVPILMGAGRAGGSEGGGARVKVVLMRTGVERARGKAELDRWVGGWEVVGEVE